MSGELLLAESGLPGVVVAFSTPSSRIEPDWVRQWLDDKRKSSQREFETIWPSPEVAQIAASAKLALLDDLEKTIIEKESVMDTNKT